MIMTLNLIIQALFTSLHVFTPAAVVLLMLSYYMWGDYIYDEIYSN